MTKITTIKVVVKWFFCCSPNHGSIL